MLFYLSVLSPFALQSVAVARSAHPSHALFFPSPFLQAHASSFRFQAEPLKREETQSENNTILKKTKTRQDG